MPVLIKYLLETGMIDGMFTGTSQAILEAQIVASDPTYGYLLTELEPMMSLGELVQRYVVKDGALQEKALLTLVADPMQFMADGLDECLISVEPIVACTLRVNGLAREVTVADPILELTSDTPMAFVITLELMASHWAEPITVAAL